MLLAAIALFIFRPMERRIIDAQEEIHRKQILAEAASQAKSDFLAVMRHEIRTPMNGILGMAELLCQTKTDEKQDMMIGIIDRSGRALLAIINDILDFSKIEANKTSLDLQPFEFAALAEGLVELLRPQAEAKKIFLRLKVEGDLAARHVGDCGRVQQILTNLIGNAVKFTNAGGVAVKITASPAEGGNQDICVAVSDTGIGISNDHLQRIFLPFEQADGGTSRSFGGTGLGLAISKSLVEAMGGTIVADSTRGKGSQFTLSLTLRIDAFAPVIRAEDAAPEMPSRIGHNVRILVAEDNEVNQFVILQMLELAGYESVLARDGEEAVARFESMEPDLVLMDVSMPRMDGYAATRTIRDHERTASRKHTPIIGLTAHVLPVHRQRCLDAGMDAVLSKPITRLELDQALLDHLRGTEVLQSA